MSSTEKFNAAVKVINSLPQNGPFQPAPELLLKFYAYHKQATEGPCNTEKPYFWDILSKQKWNAWKNLGAMPKEEAMEKYVEELIKIVETMSYNEAISNFMDTMGPLYETVWLDQPETEASGNAETEMSDSSFEVIKQEHDIKTEKKFTDVKILQNASQAVEKAKHTFQFVNPCVQQANNRSRKVQKMSFSKPVEEKASSTKSSNSATSSILKAAGNQRFAQTATVSRDVLRRSESIQYSRNIPGTTLKEILFISVISLQHSLEEIMKRLDRIETLIKIQTLKKEERTHPSERPSVLGLPHWATMFIILWPFLSQWIVLARWQKR